ncbi:hypothetical protein ACS0TY_010618 [Phlomoides rotata]
MEMMQGIPFEKSSTIRRLAKELGVNKNQVARWIKEGLIKPHAYVIHLELTQMNKLQRLKFSLNALVHSSEANQIKFSSMHNVVHIDEKWFYMTRSTKRYYMLPGESSPIGLAKAKRIIDV